MKKPNVRKSGRDYSRWRAGSLIAVHLLIGLHIAHWLIKGRTLAPLEFNEVLHTLHLGIITAGFIFMALTVFGTLVAGRFFCSWGCHILALQDLSAWLLAKLRIRPQPIRSRTLLWAPLLAVLYLFVWPQVVRLAGGAGLPQFRVQADGDGWASFATNHFWRNLPGPGITLLTFAVVGGLTVYFLGTRGFCQYACPYGAIFGLADRLAPGKIKLVGDCSQCGLCTAQCQSHVLVHREVAKFGKVVNSQCLKDLDCVAVCPNQALAYGFTKPSFWQSLNREERLAQPYSFTWREDLVIAAGALALVIIYRGLYDAIPFLLSVAIAIILSTLFVTMVRLWRRPTVRLNNLLLKHDGQWRTAGRWFAALTIALGLLSLHSAMVHYQTYAGRRAVALASPTLPDSSESQVEVRAAIRDGSRSDDEARTASWLNHLRRARAHLRRCSNCAGGSGIFPSVLRQLRSAEEAPTAVLTEALMRELPEDPSKRNKPAGGRNLLVFSDSRQRAAFFAPYLKNTTAQCVFLGPVWRAIQESESHIGEPAPVDEIARRFAKYVSDGHLPVVPLRRRDEEGFEYFELVSARTLAGGQRRQLESEVRLSLFREVCASPTRADSLAGLGLAATTFDIAPGALEEARKQIADIFTSGANFARALIESLLLVIARRGAIRFPEMSQLNASSTSYKVRLGSSRIPRIIENLRAVLNVARDRMENCRGCSDLHSSCYACLRSYSNQFWWEQLRRRPVLEWLDRTLGPT
jgi:polyferredoxin